MNENEDWKEKKWSKSEIKRIANEALGPGLVFVFILYFGIVFTCIWMIKSDHEVLKEEVKVLKEQLEKTK